MVEARNNTFAEDFFYGSKNYMFVLSADGNFKEINPSFLKVLKIPEKDLATTPFTRIVSPEDHEKTNHFLVNQLQQTSSSCTLEIRIQTHDKSTQWIKFTSAYVSPLKDLYLCAYDITDSKRKQLENSDIQNKLFQIIELVPHPIFLKDHKGRYTLVNQAQASLFSVSKDRLIGKDDSYFTKSSEELKAIRESDLRVIEKKESVSLPEQVITRLDGSIKILHTIKIPFKSSTEQNISILGVSIDLTEIKKVEKELRITNFELDSFVYRSSHDLRAPLCSLTGLLNLIQKETEPVIINNCIDEAKKSIRKLDSFIADLTNLSRNSRLEAKPEKIDFDALIKECIDHLHFMDNAQRISYEINIKNQGGFEFYSDEDRLKIIFMNLISNSIKYQRPDHPSPFIEVTVELGEYTLITISDNGMGIENIYQEKVFEMFFRASDNSFGSGLGLYIVKQITERLKGSISLQSTLGAGTKVEIKLPHLIRAKRE